MAVINLINRMNHKITALTRQKRNRGRINVYLDGNFAFGLEHIVAAWLRVGQEISDEKILKLQQEDCFEVAYKRAVNFLSYRPRTEYEIKLNLRKHKVDQDIQGKVIDRLQRGNLIDDARFAETWIENRSEHRPRSRRMLASELRKRGVEIQVIDNALKEIDDNELAYRAATKQSRKFQHLEKEVYRKKMFGFLSRRGFNYSDSLDAVNQTWNEVRKSRKNLTTEDRL